MTTFDYTRAKATATRLLTKFGAAATIVRTTNTGDAWNPTQSSVEYACIAVVMDYSNHEIDGTLVLATDKKVLVAASVAITPTVADKFGTMAIVRVQPLQPAGTTVMYELQCRG